METSNPEKVITAVRDASQTIETKGLIDRQFPDLRKTFTDPSIYDITQSEVVQPVIVKQNITFPTSALDDIKQFDPTSPHGIAPFMNRAYFVVKSKLYLWDYLESGNLVIHQEEDDIVGVGFVQPKENIFREDIKNLLIIATTREVKVIAVSYDRLKGLQIFQTGMTTNTTGVHMVQILGTKLGRVFMLGNDGNVWELDYKTEETWFSSKCSKKLHTSNNNPLGFLIGHQKNPIIQMAVNENGTVLYQLTENNSIYVTYLGRDNSTFETVYRNTDVYNEARKTNTHTVHLRVDKFKIVSIHPTTCSESIGYHLVAITSTGCRIYYNHHKDGQHLLYDAPPNALVTVHVRSPSNEFSTSDVVNKTIYNNGLFMLVKNQASHPTQDKIITLSPDLGNLGNCTSVVSDIRLLEFYNTVDIHGKVLTMIEAPSSSNEIDELKLSYNSPARHFLVLTTSGISVLVKQRPVDMLYKLLVLTGQDTSYRIRDFESFFSHFGFINSCSLCFNLICYSSAVIPNKNDLFIVEPIPDFVEKGAKVLLEKFGQVPSLLNDSYQYTSRHDGLVLFIYRALDSVWSKLLIKRMNKPDGTIDYKMNISLEELKASQQVLRKLSSFMEQNTALFPKTPVNPETQSLKNISELVSYLNEAMSFFLYLNETSLSSVVQLMKPDSQELLLKTDLKNLLTTTEGRSITNDLSFALINYTFKKYDNTAYVTDVLSQYCGSFCGANDVLLYKAADQIYSTRNVHNTNQAKAILMESLTILKRIALHIPADKAREIADVFASQNYHIYGVQFVLACAQARDPKQTSNAYVESGFPPNDPKAQVFQSKQPFYDIIIKLLEEVLKKHPSTTSTVDSNIKEIFNTAFEHNDKAFQYYAYGKFIELNLGQQLIKQSAPHLEEFLNRAPFTYKRLSLLADYYRLNERYEEAAYTYYQLATLPGENINMNTRIDNLTTASVCAKSVTAPAKQYELFHLMQDIDQHLTNFNK